MAGAALSYADTRVRMKDLRDGDATAIQTVQVTAYASRHFGDWYVDGMLAWAQQDFSGHRDTGLNATAQSRFGGQQWSSRLQAGRPLALGSATTLTPLLGLEWTRLAQEGYTETQAGALSLQVDARTSERWRSVAGVKWGTEFGLSRGLSLLPSVKLSWQHDLHQGGLETTASFLGGGPSFVTPAQSQPRDSWSLGGALALQRGKAFTLALQLDGERAPGYTAYAAQVVGRWLF